MSASSQRVFVLLIGPGKTAAELNELYGVSDHPRYRGKRPGEAAILAELEKLRRTRDAVEDAEGRWTLTEAAQREWDSLEDKHTNSGGYGDYGF